MKKEYASPSVALTEIEEISIMAGSGIKADVLDDSLNFSGDETQPNDMYVRQNRRTVWEDEEDN